MRGTSPGPEGSGGGRAVGSEQTSGELERIGGAASLSSDQQVKRGRGGHLTQELGSATFF